jgi:cation diffusion facilitator CzcD-associated flavoprotein CzcO
MAVDDVEAKPALNGEILVASDKAPTTAQVDEELKSAPKEETSKTVECDVLVVGAGFSGITSIHRFRKAGLNVKCFESGTDFGGVWYWNRYPGARVDSEYPFYQLNIPEVYKTWTFSERFPGHQELRKYMAHIDKVLNLRKDTYFNARVNSGTWDEAKGRWIVTTQQGHRAECKHLLLASGLLHRTYTPDFAGMKEYKGKIM